MPTWDISIPRIKRYGLILGVIGTLTALLTNGATDAAGFAVGAAIAWMTIESWARLAGALNPEAQGAKPSVKGSALFLMFRYALIGGVIVALVRGIGVTPIALLLGLLVSFAAVLIEVGTQASKSR
jgi:hypothetical protein